MHSRPKPRKGVLTPLRLYTRTHLPWLKQDDVGHQEQAKQGRLHMALGWSHGSQKQSRDGQGDVPAPEKRRKRRCKLRYHHQLRKGSHENHNEDKELHPNNSSLSAVHSTRTNACGTLTQVQPKDKYPPLPALPLSSHPCFSQQGVAHTSHLQRPRLPTTPPPPLRAFLLRTCGY